MNDNQETQPPITENSEAKVVISQGKITSQSFVQTTVIPAIKTLVKFLPVGASGFLFVSFLLQQQWVLTLITFPVTIIAVIWMAWSESVLTRFYEIYQERGKKDVDSLMAWIESINESFKEAKKWDAIDRQYQKLQGNVCKDFTAEGYKPGLNIFTPLLNEVFVPLDLSSAFLRNDDGECLPMPQGFKWDEETIELVRKEGLRIWDILKQTKKISAYRRLAILSWGGYGKTTLLRHITYIYTNKKEKQYQAPNLLPVLLLLREWQEFILNEDELTLPKLIEDYHIKKLGDSDSLILPANWARNHLLNGKMLIMIDGFDEVKESNRIKVSEWLGKEMNKYPETIFILTSRPSGYKDFINQYKMNAQLFIKPFNLNQQERFINNWYWCQERYSRGGRDTKDVKIIAINNSTNLLNQLKARPELDDLAKNPLLLNIITTLHRSYSTDELPRRRGELYREIVALQLGSRPLARKIDLLLPPDETELVLQDLALSMVIDNLPNIEYKLLVKTLESSVKSFDDTININDFIKHIIEVSELLVKRDDNYEFAHLSFQGYLAGKEIIRTQQESFLIDNWQNSWWRETILLYCSQTNPNLFLKELIKIGTQEAVKLAYDCIKETPRKINPDIEKELKKIEENVSNLLYQPLENYLKNGQWKEADQETDKVMLKVGDKDDKGYLSIENIENFPCEDLRIINDLWLQYSDGRFGFTVQRDIWLACGGKVGKSENYEQESVMTKFLEKVRWYKRDNRNRLNGIYITYELRDDTPIGHLPFTPHSLYLPYWDIFYRTKACNI